MRRTGCRTSGRWSRPCRHRHDSLIADSSQVHTTAGVELLARECGWIFPHEQPLVIEGVPARDDAQCR